jgi:hypothetical protein
VKITIEFKYPQFGGPEILYDVEEVIRAGGYILFRLPTTDISYRNTSIAALYYE